MSILLNIENRIFPGAFNNITNLYLGSLTLTGFTDLLNKKLSFSVTPDVSPEEFLKTFNDSGGNSDYWWVGRKIIALPLAFYHLLSALKVTSYRVVFFTVIVALSIFAPTTSYLLLSAYISIRLLIFSMFILIRASSVPLEILLDDKRTFNSFYDEFKYRLFRSDIIYTGVRNFRYFIDTISSLFNLSTMTDLFLYCSSFLLNAAYHSLRDLDIARGHLYTLFNDLEGVKYTQRAYLEKSCTSLRNRLCLLQTYCKIRNLDLDQEMQLTVALLNNKSNAERCWNDYTIVTKKIKKLIFRAYNVTESWSLDDIYNKICKPLTEPRHKGIALYTLLNKSVEEFGRININGIPILIETINLIKETSLKLSSPFRQLDYSFHWQFPRWQSPNFSSLVKNFLFLCKDKVTDKFTGNEPFIEKFLEDFSTLEDSASKHRVFEFIRESKIGSDQHLRSLAANNDKKRAFSHEKYKLYNELFKGILKRDPVLFKDFVLKETHEKAELLLRILLRHYLKKNNKDLSTLPKPILSIIMALTL